MGRFNVFMHKGFHDKINSVWRTLALALVLAKTDFRARNEGSYLGVAWYLLNPLLMFGVLWVVFSHQLGNNIPMYPAYLLLGIVTFNLFQQATNESAGVMLGNGGLIKSTGFPYQSLVLAVVFRALMSHVFEIAVLAAIMLALGMPLWGMSFYPLLMLAYAPFIYGVSLLLAVFTVYVIDLSNIWRFFSFLLWLATPIFYAAGAVGGVSDWVNAANPLYHFLTVFREITIYQRFPGFDQIAVIIAFSLVFWLAGSLAFGLLRFKITEKV